MASLFPSSLTYLTLTVSSRRRSSLHRLSFEGESTDELPLNISASEMRGALMVLNTIGEVEVFVTQTEANRRRGFVKSQSSQCTASFLALSSHPASSCLLSSRLAFSRLL